MAYPETRKERLAREQWMKNNSMAEEIPTTPIVEIAGPTTEEGFLATAPDYAKDMSFIQQPKKEPGPLQQVGSYVANSALGKAGEAGMEKGTEMFTDKVVTPMKTWWGNLAMPPAGPGLAGKAAAGQGVITNAAPGVMAKLGAAAGGAGSGLAAMAGPIGLGLIGAKMLGLFNKGGAVGPLSPQYHRHGDEVEVPMSRPRPMTYGEAYDKAYGKYGFDYMEPESEWGKSLYHGFNKISPSILLDAKLIQMQYNKEMREAGVPGFNQGGNVQHKEHGGMMAGPLSNNKSVKMEKKETVEYKN